MKTKAFIAVVLALFLVGCAKPDKPEVVFRPYMPDPPAELMKQPETPKTIQIPTTTP